MFTGKRDATVADYEQNAPRTRVYAQGTTEAANSCVDVHGKVHGTNNNDNNNNKDNDDDEDDGGYGTPITSGSRTRITIAV